MNLPASRREFLLTAGATSLAASMFSVLPSAAGAADGESEAGELFQTTVKLTTPKSGKDKRMPRPLDSVSCSVFIPRGLKTVRGATLNPFYEPTVKQKHWQAAASLWSFAHVGLNFFGVKNEELAETTERALAALAEVSGQPALASAPLCIHGMSIGGGLTSRLVEALPSRVIAAAPVCLEVGPRDEASGDVPMVTIFGEKDGRQMEKLTEKLPLAREQHAQWAIAPQWNQKHEWHMANNFILPFYQQVIGQRLPEKASSNPSLKQYMEKDGWLGDCATWKTPSPQVASYNDYSKDRSQACWLPDAYTAALWQAFVSYKSPVSLVSPHGIGGGKPLLTFAAGKPMEVKVATDKSAEVSEIAIYDGNRHLAKIDPQTLTGSIELDAGIHGLIAVGTLASGEKTYSEPIAVISQ